jgi:hypothetical protein
MLNFVESTTPNQATFQRSKRTSRWSKIQTKISDIDGAISISGLQPASLANFPIGHNVKLRQVDHAKPSHISEIKKNFQVEQKIQTKIPDIDGAISTSGLQPASLNNFPIGHNVNSSGRPRQTKPHFRDPTELPGGAKFKQKYPISTERFPLPVCNQPA